ncbi:MAG TPA: hypothetical protein ENJ37_10310 [Deltaproteobacteria bacterium]|nr:hypothetical protein [Deltaproteobacteria bacterium]
MPDSELKEIAALVSEKMEELAERVADIVESRLDERDPPCQCLTEEEIVAVRGLLQTRKNAVRAILWIFGALVVWILKDIYTYVMNHLAIR